MSFRKCRFDPADITDTTWSKIEMKESMFVEKKAGVLDLLVGTVLVVRIDYVPQSNGYDANQWLITALAFYYVIEGVYFLILTASCLAIGCSYEFFLLIFKQLLVLNYCILTPQSTTS